VTTPQAKTARRDAMAALDALHVQYIVVTGVPDALAAWREEFPDRVIPSLLFPCEKGLASNFGRPCFPNGTEFPEIAWLREEIKAGRIKALGEITAQYLGIAPNDPRLEPYFALAEEFDIPVTIHLGLGPPAAAYPSNPAPVKSPNYRASAGRPLLLEEVLLRHKQLRVSMMHAGWPLIDETIFMLRQHPGLYADVAVLQSTIPRSAYYEALRKLVDAGYADRIMVGSDGGVNALREGIEAILKAPFLSDTQKNDILHNNAARFFRVNRANMRR
jgi:predicted TIM-barrel fold metal-dependent hydrolase